MRLLYNIRVGHIVSLKKLNHYVICASVVVLIAGSVSCRKGATATEDRASAPPAEDVIAQADQSYAGRADLNRVRQGVVSLRQGMANDANNYEMAWRLAKFSYYVGSHTSDTGEQDKAYRQGIDAGKNAVRIQPDKPEGHFWLGANYGGNAEINTLAGLSETEDIKREMDAVIKIDEGFQAGSAYMVLGQVYLESPKILGGDTQKAIEYFEKGLKFGPNNALLRWHLAEAYVAANRNEDARKQIESILTSKPAVGFEPEYNEAVTQVKKLQEKIK